MENDMLKRLHSKELELLVAFDKVCRENDLTYSLDSGTALGAVRHGGFIPWDDDVDIAMPRRDYERLQQLGQSILPTGLFLQNKDTEPNYKRNCAKLRLEGTFFEENVYPPYKHNGIYIDIFPFDNIPSNRLIAKLNVFISRCMFYIIRTWRSEGTRGSIVLSFVKRIIDLIPRRIYCRLEPRYLAFCRKYENRKTSKTTCYFWRMTQSKSYVFEKDKLWPSKDVSFEGENVKIFNNADYYLKIMYGDYMKLPPLEKRTCHLKGKIDF